MEELTEKKIKYDMNVDSIGFTLPNYPLDDLKANLQLFLCQNYKNEIKEIRNGIPGSLRIISRIEKISELNEQGIPVKYISIKLKCGTPIKIASRSPWNKFDLLFEDLYFGDDNYISIGGLWPTPHLNAERLSNKRTFIYILFQLFSENHLVLNRIDLAVDIYTSPKNLKVRSLDKNTITRVFKNTTYLNLRKDRTFTFKIYDKAKKEKVPRYGITRIELVIKGKKIKEGRYENIHIPTTSDRDINKLVKLIKRSFNEKIEITTGSTTIRLTEKDAQDAIYDILCYCHLNTGYKKLTNSQKSQITNSKKSTSIQTKVKGFMRSNKIELDKNIVKSLKKKKIKQKEICAKLGIDPKTLRKIIGSYE